MTGCATGWVLRGLQHKSLCDSLKCESKAVSALLDQQREIVCHPFPRHSRWEAQHWLCFTCLHVSSRNKPVPQEAPFLDLNLDFSVGAEGDQDVFPAAPEPSALRSWCFSSTPRCVPAPGALQGAGLSPGCYAKGTETPLPRVPEGSRKRPALGFTLERISCVLLLSFQKKMSAKDTVWQCIWNWIFHRQ